MGRVARPARFSADDILDAAARAVRRHGSGVTLAQVARELGGPTGSIYHRFASREVLLVSLWLRSVRRFHVGLTDAYALSDPREALREATIHVPRFCRDHPEDALAMTLYQQRVLRTGAPESLRPQVDAINDDVDARLRALVPARYGQASADGYRLVMVATRLSPYGLVRSFVGGPVPVWLDEVCVAAAEGIMSLGDAPARRVPGAGGARQ